MKLSMWMLANRLSSLDLELNIREDAKPKLKSARRAYATNCVHVYQEGDDVVCNGEGDLIRIKDMQISEAFEIVQFVFDFYEDWYSEIMQLIKRKNYQEAINHCWAVFHNPIVLFDGNCRVLGITEQYMADELDEEWNYLSTYGYSSVNAIRYMKFHQPNKDFTRTGMQRFDFEGSLCYSGMTYSLYFNEALCGRINLLEKERSLNPGDYQLLDMLADILKLHLAEQGSSSEGYSNINLFYHLLEGIHVNEEQLEVQLSYQQWQKDDLYQIYVVQLNPAGERDMITLLSHTLTQHLDHCIILQSYPNIIVIYNLSLYKGIPPMESLIQLSTGNGIYLSCSLPRAGVFNMHYLLDQALASLSYGKLQFPEEIFHSFYRHAMDYIIEAKSLSDCIQACHPDVLELWKRRRTNDDYMFDTLKSYLNNERSLVNTAQALYVHRNTLVYRVKKLTEFLHYDLDDVYTRDYMKLSIRTLELYEQKLSIGASS